LWMARALSPRSFPTVPPRYRCGFRFQTFESAVIPLRQFRETLWPVSAAGRTQQSFFQFGFPLNLLPPWNLWAAFLVFGYFPIVLASFSPVSSCVVTKLTLGCPFWMLFFHPNSSLDFFTPPLGKGFLLSPPARFLSRFAFCFFVFFFLLSSLLVFFDKTKKKNWDAASRSVFFSCGVLPPQFVFLRIPSFFFFPLLGNFPFLQTPHFPGPIFLIS